MTAPLIVGAKLTPPREVSVLRRGRLVDRLVQGVPDHPLTLLTAGAGYGKTTLLSSFVRSHTSGSVWYSLGPEDADLKIFLWHLATALGNENRRFGRSLRAFLEEEQITPRSAATAAGVLLNDLERMRKPVAIVLDDFHLVAEDPAVVKFLSLVLENLKGPARFVIASRTEPPLPLGRLRVRRQVQELGPADLAFTRDELRSLLETAYSRTPTDSALDLVSRTTEGWVAAVQLVLAADPQRSGVEIPHALHRASEPGSALHDYLAEEILDTQPPELRRQLLLTSILDRIDTDLLQNVLVDVDLDGLVRELLGRRILIAYDGPNGPVYRYHALLLDFLRRRFRTEIPAEDRRELHERASEEYRRRGDLLNAARQLAIGGDASSLAAFLRDHALRLVDQGHYQALLPWLEGLPAELLDQEPELRLRLGDVRHYLGDLPGAELEYERARLRFQEREDVNGEAWSTVGLTRIWNLRGQAEMAVREGTRTLERVRREEEHLPEGRELRMRLLQVVSGARFYQGEYRQALGLLDELEALGEGRPERQAAVWNNRAVVWATQGDFQSAARAFERGLERPGTRRSPRAALHLSNLALLLNEMGDAERAYTLFQEAMELARTYHNRSQILSCLIGQARLFYRRRDFDRSLELIQEAESVNADLKLPLIEADALALRARILAAGSQFGAARAALSQALAAYGASHHDANWLLYRVESAFVDLAADRTAEAYRALSELLPLAEESEAKFPRALLLFYLGEAERRLGKPGAVDHLAEALEIARTMGYDAAIRSEMHRSFDAFALLLEKGVELDYLARIARGLGVAAEAPLLPYIGDDRLKEPQARAVLDIVEEVGGVPSHQRLRESSWIRTGPLREAAERALAALHRRHPEVEGKGAVEKGIRLRTFGELSLATSRGEIPRKAWRSQRAQWMFVYLAVKGRPVSKDRLVELFWSGTQAARAEKNFHPTLSYMRGAFKGHGDSPVVVVEDGLYRIDPGLDLEVDVHRFETAVSRARAAERIEEKLLAYEEARALYRGDFLEGLYDAWAEDLRTQLALRFENVLEESATLLYDEKEFSRALPVYQELLKRNPYQEETHVRVMMCYHQTGDRRAVKEQFESLSQLLRTELDVSPLPETAALYESLMVSP